MSIAQFAVLRHIDRLGPVELSRLADALVMDRTTLYRALSPLEKAGWIGIEPVGHGRAKQVALTEEGRRALLAATPVWRAAQTRLADDFGPANWTALLDGLATITTLAQEERR